MLFFYLRKVPLLEFFNGHAHFWTFSRRRVTFWKNISGPLIQSLKIPATAGNLVRFVVELWQGGLWLLINFHWSKVLKKSLLIFLTNPFIHMIYALESIFDSRQAVFQFFVVNPSLPIRLHFKLASSSNLNVYLLRSGLSTVYRP